MKNTMTSILFLAVLSVTAHAQIMIPEGTPIRLRLEQNLSSATAEEGQTIELSVTQDIKVGNTIVIAEGARATGTVVIGVPKRRLGRPGKLDFSIDRVRAVDGAWIPLRYTPTKKQGGDQIAKTTILTAGIGLVFWPAAPVGLMIKGKDVTINKGMAFAVFTDNNHTVASGGPQTPSNPAPAAGNSTQSATLTVIASTPGAEIELDGSFVGSAPTTLQIPEGVHRVSVTSGSQTWNRQLYVTAGSAITVSANLAVAGPATARRAPR